MGETESVSYCLAYRYESEGTSGTGYKRVRGLLRRSGSELSVYRLQWKADWYVVVIGNTPEETLDEGLQKAMSGGQPAGIEEQLLDFLIRRREEASKEGHWVERHHRPGKRFEL